MRAGVELPTFSERSEIFQHGPKELRTTPDPLVDKQFLTWLEYYRSKYSERHQRHYPGQIICKQQVDKLLSSPKQGVQRIRRVRSELQINQGEVPSLPDNHQAIVSGENNKVLAMVIPAVGKNVEPLALQNTDAAASLMDGIKTPANLCKSGKQGKTYTLKLLSRETGNFDAKTGYGGSVRVMETKAGEQYVVKISAGRRENGNLLRQARRMQEMRAAGIAIIPEIVDINIKDEKLYYVMPYLKGEAADEAFFEHMTDEEFLGKLNTMLSHFDQELWSKGASSHEQHHFSQRRFLQVRRGLEGIQNVSSEGVRVLLEKETFTVNDERVTSLPVLLSWLKQSSSLLDGVFAAAKDSSFYLRRFAFWQYHF